MHQLANVYDSSNHVVGMKLTFLDFKHNYNQRPFTMVIHRQPASCPIQLLLDYLALRGNRQGLIFLTQVRTPVTREAFALQLADAIRFSGLDPARYKGHSFRIGALRTRQSRGCLIRKSVQLVDGGRMRFISIFEFHPCPLSY